MIKVNAIFFIFLIFSLSIKSQTIEGIVKNGELLEKNVKISILETKNKSFANENGYFFLDNSKTGSLTLVVSKDNNYEKEFTVDIKNGLNVIEINIANPSYDLDQIVVTGTKTNRRKKDSPIIVNIIDSEKLDNIQACNLFEGLNFQPGIRVETNCQSCNYTQLRMNGLGGNYSQILINGKSILSPLSGLYGLEQIPVNMIDRIEVVTGGSSALYGSSAVGGIVNILTRKADKNGHSFELHYGLINNSSLENIISTNSNILSKSKKVGFSVFTNFREREFYDHNNDNFSELSKIEDYSVGTNVIINLNKHKIEFNLGNINEYRIGGEMINKRVEMLKQAEERKHKIYFGNLDYNINLNKETSLTSFAAFQYTDRSHFTGIRPIESTLEDSIYLSKPPFGKSESQVFQIGTQINRTIKNHTFSVGYEIIQDEIFDKIKAYDYLVQQSSTTTGGFIQGDWIFFNKLNILTGIRLDKHSMIENLILSPRVAFNYKLIDNFQFRFSYGTGYRSPQSFDSDLHMTFSGGGISRIEIDNDLKEEKSRSFSSSINYDLLTKKIISGITLQSFHTTLDNTFIQEYLGEDDYGQVFLKTNGQSAKVYGLTLDYRLNFKEKIELESSFTMQRSKHSNGISYSSELEKTKRFLKTPNTYGYLSLGYVHDKKISLAININNTGKMKLIHYAGAPEQADDEYIKTSPFNTIDLKVSYTSILKKLKSKLKYSIGVKNITNDYQSDFDSTRNRDSNFIYGPGNPRYIYININYSTL